MKRSKLLAAIGAAAALTISLASPANAEVQDDVVLTTEEDRGQYDWFVQNGVEPDVARELIARFNEGDAIDSLSGVDPSEVTVQAVDGWQVTRSEYPDGSISVSKVADPELSQGEADGGFSVSSVSNCANQTSGSGWVAYYDCAVVHSNGLWLTIEFRASYTRTSNGVGHIQSVGSPYAHSVYGSATTPSLTIPVASGRPAHARAATQYTSAGGSGGGGTAVLNLYVNGSGAWTENSGY